jgi:hypothetical protein
MGQIAESCRFYEIDKIIEIVSDPGSVMGIGSQTYHISSKFFISQKDVPVKQGMPS